MRHYAVVRVCYRIGMKSETIFLAKPTDAIEKIYGGYARFFDDFYKKLSIFHFVQTPDLPDIWVRDFLPVQHAQTKKLTQLFFNPHYANYTRAFNEKIRRRVSHYFPYAQAQNVTLDGGNLCIGKDTLFCLWRPAVFPQKNLTAKHRAERLLKNATGVKKVVWLARETGDKIGHIDGFMQFLGDTLFVSDERFDPYLRSLSQKRVAQIRGVLPDINIVFLPCVPDLADPLSARGVYVNFLATSRAVFVPQYHLSQDARVLAIIQAYTDKPVIGVDCAHMARYGGAVHCLTKEYCV